MGIVEEALKAFERTPGVIRITESGQDLIIHVDHAGTRLPATFKGRRIIKKVIGPVETL